MMKRNIKLLILGTALACANHTYAANPGLWEGTSAKPPQTLQMQEAGLEQGSFEYVSLSPVYFDTGKATLTHDGQRALDAASNYLLSHANIQRILIEGHTDDIGNVAYNDTLSDRRAEIVRNYLTIKGVDPNLINLMGKGEHQPVDQNWTREGRLRNRHVSIYAIHWNQ